MYTHSLSRLSRVNIMRGKGSTSWIPISARSTRWLNLKIWAWFRGDLDGDRSVIITVSRCIIDPNLPVYLHVDISFLSDKTGIITALLHKMIFRYSRYPSFLFCRLPVGELPRLPTSCVGWRPFPVDRFGPWSPSTSSGVSLFRGFVLERQSAFIFFPCLTICNREKRRLNRIQTQMVPLFLCHYAVQSTFTP